MQNIVDGLEGVVNIANDVLVFAMKYDKFKENVINFLDRCVEHDLYLNPEKMRINVDSVPFFRTDTDERLFPNGYLQVASHPELVPAKKCQGTTKFSGICKLSFKVYTPSF